jgi:hypothetical protein
MMVVCNTVYQGCTSEAMKMPCNARLGGVIQTGKMELNENSARIKCYDELPHRESVVNPMKRVDANIPLVRN